MNNICYDSPFDENTSSTEGDILSKRYRATVLKRKHEKKWASEHDVMSWLVSIGVDVKCTISGTYVCGGKVCSLNHVLIMANKKRIELGLDPFYVEGVTEF
jgi:hypothetical protein